MGQLQHEDQATQHAVQLLQELINSMMCPKDGKLERDDAGITMPGIKCLLHVAFVHHVSHTSPQKAHVFIVIYLRWLNLEDSFVPFLA